MVTSITNETAKWGNQTVLLHDDSTVVAAGAWDGSIEAVAVGGDGRPLQRLAFHQCVMHRRWQGGLPSASCI